MAICGWCKTAGLAQVMTSNASNASNASRVLESHYQPGIKALCKGRDTYMHDTKRR